MRSRVLVISNEREEKEDDKNLEIAFRLLKGIPRSVGSPGVAGGDSPVGE